MRGVRMPPELEAAITAWIERQPDPKPSRSEAIRRLIEMGLGCEVDALRRDPGAGILISDIKSLALQQFYCARIPLATALQAVLA